MLMSFIHSKRVIRKLTPEVESDGSRGMASSKSLKKICRQNKSHEGEFQIIPAHFQCLLKIRLDSSQGRI